MKFVGIDLAWSTKNKSGIAICTLKNNILKVDYYNVVHTDEEILELITEHVGEENCRIAIDAPLIVTNETGRREAEAQLTRDFRAHHAGAHPSNRTRLSSWNGTIRGEELAQKFEAIGYTHTPCPQNKNESKQILEVYPHPAMIVLFNLTRVIPYKAKPKRTYESRWSAFETYAKHMGNLKHKKPALILPEHIEEIEIHSLRGKALKEYEDKLDALFCAYIAAYSWIHNGKCTLYGNLEEGYILTPTINIKT